MKFARIGTPGHELPVIVVEGAAGSDSEATHYDLTSITADINGDFLASDGPARAAEALAAGTLPVVENAASQRIGSPIARPSAVICIGMNYAAHAAESGSEPPAIPIIFLKTPNTVVGPNDTVTIPKPASKPMGGRARHRHRQAGDLPRFAS